MIINKKIDNIETVTIDEKKYIIRNFLKSIEQTSNDEAKNIQEALTQAKLDWQLAEQYFNLIDNPQLIDYAIYNQKACEEKYRYLIKKAKEMKLINQNDSVTCITD